MNERIKRPEMERTAPVRNWGTVFGAVPRGAPAGSSGAPGRSGAADPVGRGVESGYRVVDEYLRAGQAAARAIWSPFLPQGAGEPPREGAHYNPWTGAAAPWGGSPGTMPDEVAQRMGTMVRAATDLAMMWMDFLGASGPRAGEAGYGTAAAPRGPVAGPFTAGTAPAASPPAPTSPGAAPEGAPTPATPATPATREERTFVTVEVASARRVEVTVELRASPSIPALRALELRATEGDAHFGGVVVETHPDEEHVVFRVTVPADVPAGVYMGGIVDPRSNAGCGWLTVRIHPAESAAV